jgi:hypothetical protein
MSGGYVKMEHRLMRDWRFLALPPLVRELWRCLLHHADEHYGIVPPPEGATRLFQLIPPESVVEGYRLLSELTGDAGEPWLELRDGRWVLPGCERTPPKSGAERTKAWRERHSVTKRDVTVTLCDVGVTRTRRDVTPTETETKTNTETEPCPTLSQETPCAQASPAREGQGRAGKYVDLAAWVPGWYCTEGFQPNPQAKVIGYALKAATEEQILEALQEPTGIARLATMAARGWSGDASEGVVKQLLLEIVKDSQRSKR